MSASCLSCVTSFAGNAKHSKLFAAYAYYNVPGAHSLQALMEDALILAKQVRGIARAHCVV